MDSYSIFWLVWFLLLLLGFAVVESIAIFGKRRKYDTLTQNIQWVVRLNRSKGWRLVSAGLWITFASWFLWHIWID